jgi:hypothetical protein
MRDDFNYRHGHLPFIIAPDLPIATQTNKQTESERKKKRKKEKKKKRKKEKRRKEGKKLAPPSLCLSLSTHTHTHTHTHNSKAACLQLELQHMRVAGTLPQVTLTALTFLLFAPLNVFSIFLFWKNKTKSWQVNLRSGLLRLTRRLISLFEESSLRMSTLFLSYLSHLVFCLVMTKFL